MCFSPQASFGATALLSVLGGTALKRTKQSRYVLIALIPLMFGVQQALEGFVWLALQRGDTTSLWYTIPVYGFLFFAAVWWPLYIPIMLWYLETVPSKKQWLIMPVVAGVIVALIALLHTCFTSIEAVAIGHHISYQQTTPPMGGEILYNIGLGAYLIATAGALFISSIRYTWLMGIIVVVAFATAQLWYYLAFGSVWCFFAAIASSLIVLVVG